MQLTLFFKEKPPDPTPYAPKAGKSQTFCEAIAPPCSARTLKIEADGDFSKGLIKPKIRLTGRWLAEAGFKPGRRVCVVCLAPGLIELRSLNHVSLPDARVENPPSPEL